jgi:putative peptide zinc metalloprotease protein
MTGSEIPTGRYPASRRIVTELADGRCQVNEPRSGRHWAMGGDAMFTASLFDGLRTYDDIAGLVREQCGQALTVDRLVAFEKQSLKLGLLEPAAGIDGRRLALAARAIACPTLVQYTPAPLINRLWPRLQWLTSPVAVGAILVSLAGGGAVVVSRADEFSRELASVLPHTGLIVVYCFAFASAAFHEGAHALACRRYGVPVSLVAFGLLCLFPVAWTVPDQRTWNSLPLRHRLVTIGAGPIGSLVFTGVGTLFWLAGHRFGVFRLTGLLAMSTGPVVMLPTLIPVFPGDAYLALTELARRPGLRQVSLRYLAAATRRGRPRAVIPAVDKTWYLGFGIVTITAWAGALFLLGWLIWHARHLAII